MIRGFAITQKGLALLAKLHSGGTLEITRVMIGEGQVPEVGNLRDLEDLVAPVAQAASTKPVTVGTTTSFVVQYRNDLNGGLGRDININEYGVFANDPDEGEILLYVANLGDYYEPVPARRQTSRSPPGNAPCPSAWRRVWRSWQLSPLAAKQRAASSSSTRMARLWSFTSVCTTMKVG